MANGFPNELAEIKPRGPCPLCGSFLTVVDARVDEDFGHTPVRDINGISGFARGQPSSRSKVTWRCAGGCEVKTEGPHLPEIQNVPVVNAVKLKAVKANPEDLAELESKVRKGRKAFSEIDE